MDKKYKFKRLIDLVIASTAFGVGIYFDWEIINALLFGGLVWVILNPWPSRIFAYLALAALLITPFATVIGKEKKAEEFAIYAFYFLVLAVAMMIKESRVAVEDK